MEDGFDFDCSQSLRRRGRPPRRSRGRSHGYLCRGPSGVHRDRPRYNGGGRGPGSTTRPVEVAGDLDAQKIITHDSYFLFSCGLCLILAYCCPG